MGLLYINTHTWKFRRWNECFTNDCNYFATQIYRMCLLWICKHTSKIRQTRFYGTFIMTSWNSSNILNLCWIIIIFLDFWKLNSSFVFNLRKVNNKMSRLTNELEQQIKNEALLQNKTRSRQGWARSPKNVCSDRVYCYTMLYNTWELEIKGIFNVRVYFGTFIC